MAARGSRHHVEILVQVPAAARECQLPDADLDVLEHGLLETFGAFEPRVGWIAPPPLARDDRRTMAELTR